MTNVRFGETDAEKCQVFSTILPLIMSGTVKMAMREVGTDNEINLLGYVQRLLRINKGWQDATENKPASLFLTSGKDETVAIGQEIHAALGMPGMMGTHQLITFILTDLAARHLESAWSGIGEWQQ